MVKIILPIFLSVDKKVFLRLVILIGSGRQVWPLFYSKVQSSGFKIQGSRGKVQGSRFTVQDSKFGILDISLECTNDSNLYNVFFVISLDSGKVFASQFVRPFIFMTYPDLIYVDLEKF